MSRIEYEYFIEFSFPESVKRENDFDNIYTVDDTSYFIVRDNKRKKGCTFSLHIKRSTEKAETHDPSDYERFASELEHLYNIVSLSIAYLTGYIVRSHQSNDLSKNISDSLPEIRHNFYERCKKANIEIPKKIASVSFKMNAYIIHKLNPERLKLLNGIVKSIKSDKDNIKFDVLESYFKGFISKVCPYFYWYHIVEIFLNPKLKFYERKGKNKLGDVLSVGDKEIDYKFLRFYSHMFRHSSHHINSIKSAGELENDLERIKYLKSPQKARGYYEKNLRIIIDRIILGPKTN